MIGGEIGRIGEGTLLIGVALTERFVVFGCDGLEESLSQEKLGDTFEHVQAGDLVLMSPTDGGDEEFRSQPAAKEEEPTQEDMALDGGRLEAIIQINTDG